MSDFFDKLSAATSAGSKILNGVMSIANYNYQKKLQNKIFEREDSAIQRRVADAEKAGFNKFSVLGEGSPAGSVVSTTAPTVEDPAAAALDTMNAKSQLAINRYSAQIAKNDKEQSDLDTAAKRWEFILGLAKELDGLGMASEFGIQNGDFEHPLFDVVPAGSLWDNKKVGDDVFSTTYFQGTASNSILNIERLQVKQAYEKGLAELKNKISEGRIKDAEAALAEFEEKHKAAFKALDVLEGFLASFGVNLFHKF